MNLTIESCSDLHTNQKKQIMADRMASMMIVKECLYMTEQWNKAMEYLYAQEQKTCSSIKKAVIDEALDQLMERTDSERDWHYLVQNALSNARKKVYRYSSRHSVLDELGALPSDGSRTAIMEWQDIAVRAGLTERQRLVLRRCEQGYHIKEIALECGLSVKAVYSIRQRARAVILDYVEHGA